MSKHTPGPWKSWQPKNPENLARGPQGHWEVATDSLDRRQCVVQSVYSEANARLIAAAPELLAALEEVDALMSHSEDCARWHVSAAECTCLVARVRAAIARATEG